MVISEFQLCRNLQIQELDEFDATSFELLVFYISIDRRVVCQKLFE